MSRDALQTGNEHPECSVIRLCPSIYFRIGISHTLLSLFDFWAFPPQATNMNRASITKGRPKRKMNEPADTPGCVPQSTAASRPIVSEQYACTLLIGAGLLTDHAQNGPSSCSDHWVREHNENAPDPTACRRYLQRASETMQYEGLSLRTLCVHETLMEATTHTDATPTAAPPKRAHKEETRQIYGQSCE